MSLFDRMELEEGKVNTTEFLMKTCFQCKFWNHFVKRDYSYCHRCVNNLRIPIRKGKGFSIEGLYDYYMLSESTLTRKRRKIWN
jgi:hypothetical protein